MKHLSEEIRVPIEPDNLAIQRVESLCIRCGKCRDVCKKEIGVLGRYDLLKTNDTAICIHCGQCANVCPTGSISERKAFMDVHRAILDPNKKVVFMTSPSVRVALGEEFGYEPGSFKEKEMVAALRKLGADFVFDTTFAADLTIMEEASELIHRISNKGVLPQFTSCCPGWVRFAEVYYPELLPNISTSKSPISMFGPTIKTYFAQNENLASEDIVSVALTPCTAKKAEIKRDEMVSASVHLGKEKQYDVDHVITTRELALWMKANNLDLENVGTSDYDSLMPRGSGAGVIFGNTGGVMEAALRTAYYMLCKKQPNADLLTFEAARGMENVKEGMVNIDGLKLRVAIIHTLDALRKFVQTKKLNDYHFIEVMCCPGGCIGGGGQPKAAMGMSDDIRLKRIAGLYSADEQSVVRNSHDNEAIKKVYEHFYGQPLSSLAEKLLHTTYQDRSTILNEDPAKYHYQEESTVDVQAKTSMQVAYQCSVCGYIYDGKDFNAELDSYVCPICNVPKQLFDEIAVETTLKQKEEVKTKQWVCSICGYVYDGENFAAEPDSYVCPICTVPKTMFEER